MLNFTDTSGHGIRIPVLRKFGLRSKFCRKGGGSRLMWKRRGK
jgi:hypothetical protein